jgi:hypothetical protein
MCDLKPSGHCYYCSQPLYEPNKKIKAPNYMGLFCDQFCADFYDSDTEADHQADDNPAQCNGNN